ncbi:MAG: T9SS type A sorting domain-containing protein [Bacteroidia bacterium]|nr:T9SS type A sorting domain-containing protein [Bacteroidia bacterium]
MQKSAWLKRINLSFLLFPLCLHAQTPFLGGADYGVWQAEKTNATCLITGQINAFGGSPATGPDFAAKLNGTCTVSSLISAFSGGIETGNIHAAAITAECTPAAELSPFSGSPDFASNQAKRTNTNCFGPNSTIKDINPRTVCEGDSIVISGTYLTDVSAVVFSENVFSTAFTLRDSITIQALVPSGALSGPVSVTGDGGTAYSSTALQIYPQPIASFDMQQTEGFTFAFTSSATAANDYFWDFGAGHTANGQTASFTFDGNGTYQVVHIVANNCGNDTLSSEVLINTTGLSRVQQSTIQVFPNPFKRQLQLQAGNHKGQLNVSLYNMLGQLVYAKKITVSEESLLLIDTGMLLPGVYTLLVNGVNTHEFRRLVKAE